MHIKWIGHSCFKVVYKNQSIIIDPYQDGSVPGLKDIREQANLVLCSHDHHDHNGKENVQLINCEESIFTIEKIKTFHDDCNGNKRGLNTIHVIDNGKERICHLGDLGHLLDNTIIKKLEDVDVLLIPIGGYFTIDYKQAYQLVKQIKPKIVIPMHYRLNKQGYQVLDTIDNFINCFNQDEVIMPKCNSITLTESYYNKVVVLTL